MLATKAKDLTSISLTHVMEGEKAHKFSSDRHMHAVTRAHSCSHLCSHTYTHTLTHEVNTEK